jgi:hypothetical protein
MKKDSQLSLFEIILGIIAISILIVIIAISILDIQKNSFKSYGALVLGVIIFIIFLSLIGLWIKKRFPKSRVGESISNTTEKFVEIFLDTLSLT